MKLNIFVHFCSNSNGNGHYSSQSMQQAQPQYMSSGNMPSNGYNGNHNQYSSGPYMQRAPIYGGKYCKE